MRRITPSSLGTKDTTESGFDDVLQPLTAPFASYTADFENIGKVGGKAQTKRNVDREASVIHHLKLFVADALPQKFGSQHMQRATRE